MFKTLTSLSAPAPQERLSGAFKPESTDVFDLLAKNYQTAVESLTEDLQRYQLILDRVSQGICLFDASSRLVLANRRYSEIYHLSPDDTRPGTTLREIVERRFALGANRPGSTPEDYLNKYQILRQNTLPKTFTNQMADGRSVVVHHQSLSDGGWISTHDDITKRTHDAISLQTLIDALPEYLWVKDEKSRFVIVNKFLASDFDFESTEKMLGKSDFDILPEFAEDLFAQEQKIIRTGQAIVDSDEFHIVPNGTSRWLSTTKIPLRGKNGKIFGIVGISRDISEQRRIDNLRNGQAHLLEMITMGTPLKQILNYLIQLIESQVKGISGSILIVDPDGIHLHHMAAPNLPDAYTRLIDGIASGPNCGSCGTAVHRQAPVIVADIASDPLWQDFRELAAKFDFHSCWSTPILAHQGGVLGTFALYSREIRSPTETETNLIDFATRIAGIAIERKQAEERIQFLATHDALTGLPNRTMLTDHLNAALAQAGHRTQQAGHGTQKVSVIFIDLDNFKNINDSLGHSAGDELLKIISARLARCLGPSDIVGRFGGDEFVIILMDSPESLTQTIEIIQNIRKKISEPARIQDRNLTITSSIGIATYPEDGASVEALLANADAAMYHAKEIGRDNFQIYTPALNARIQAKLQMQEDLRVALARNELVLNYQPQVCLRSGRMFAVEALIRWNHPVRGCISPVDFIPLAEETGLIIPIGKWVLLTACQQVKAWHDAGFPHLNVCVNVSARQFEEKDWVSTVVQCLEATGLAARYLELEITESVIMQNIDHAIVTMNNLRDLGVHLAIDDFGTGYSSLSALKNFPVGRLKIDRSFIGEIPNNTKDNAVVRGMIRLGKALHLKVIAEGVETQEQVEFLHNQKCDEMQGYFFSRPVPSSGIEALLRKVAPGKTNPAHNEPSG